LSLRGFLSAVPALGRGVSPEATPRREWPSDRLRSALACSAAPIDDPAVRQGTVALRRFEPSDAQRCSEVINAAIQNMGELDAHTRAFIVARNVPEAIAAELGRSFTLVAVGPARVEAVGALAGEQLERVYVHPSCQRQGIGALLVRALEAEARRGGVRRLTLQASPSSVPFYQALGFVALGQETSRNGEAVFVHVRMSKDLGELQER
jgi:GNAT superfamily N-acetyltransferase